MAILAGMGVRGRGEISDATFREFFERSDLAFCVGEIIRGPSGKATDLRFLAINDAFIAQTGRSPKLVLGFRITEVIPGFPTDLIESIGKAAEFDSVLAREALLPALGNRWYAFRAYPLSNQRFMLLLADISPRKQTEQTLQESEALLADIVETMDQLVWSTRPDGYHDFFNSRWYNFTGTEPGSGDGEDWTDLIHPEDRERATQRWRESLASGQPYEVEYRLRHHTKGWRWVLGRAHPVRTETGEIIRWMGTCTDIHRQKELAEELELATEELSHRIKNIFTVISALIGLSLREFPEAKAYGEELRARIEALGKAHDYARPHGKSSAPAAPPATVLGLIRQLLKPYQIEGRNRVVVEGDDAPLNHHASTPLSLAVHELATNSAKYGAFSAHDGQVRVTGSLTGETYELGWIERGGPVTQEPARFGFGSRLVEVSLQNRLNGKLVRLWRPEGLTVRLSAPASGIIQST